MRAPNTHIMIRLLVHADYPITSNCRTKILAIFRGTFVISCGFQNRYVFIPLLLSEILKVFCGTLFEKHSLESTAVLPRDYHSCTLRKKLLIFILRKLPAFGRLLEKTDRPRMNSGPYIIKYRT